MEELYTYLPPMIADPIQEYFASEAWVHLLFLMKTVSGIVSVLLLLGVIYLVIKTNYIGVRVEMYSEAAARKSFVVPKKKMAKKWQEIKTKAESAYEADYKLALLEADKIFDESLKLMGLSGKDMADRLKMLNKEQLHNLDDVWWAHKLRNKMVHETHFKIAHSDVKTAIAIFEKAFEEFGALD